jgi:5-methylcytosine-specific restriction endonuclease McrA
MDPALRELVRRRARDRCEYCHIHQEDEPFFRFQIEHVVPRQHGGQTVESNLALACRSCNLHKGPNLTGIDPATGNIVPLLDPRRQDWGDHFAVRDAFVVGLTATGRTTAQVLAMNAPSRIRLRALSM